MEVKQKLSILTKPDPDVRYLSYSQIQSFTHCEQKWGFSSLRKLQAPEPNRGMILGSLIHKCVQAWWKKENWFEQIELWIKSDEISFLLPETALEIGDQCEWIMNRYAEMYKGQNEKANVLAQELEIWVELPRKLADLPFPIEQLPRYGIHLFIDQIMEYDGSIVGAEFKSMQQFGREEWLEADQQLTNYDACLAILQTPIDYWIFDAIKTFRWKGKERPVNESFRRFPVIRSPRERAVFIKDAYRTALTMHQAELRGYLIKNISTHCARCEFGDVCLEMLAGDSQAAEAILKESFIERIDSRTARNLAVIEDESEES